MLNRVKQFYRQNEKTVQYVAITVAIVVILALVL